MAWIFPDDKPFDLRTDGSYYSNCRVVEANGDHLTVDYEAKADVRLRAQFRIEDIRELVYRAPIVEEMARR